MRIYKSFRSGNRITLFNGDCIDLLKSMPDESVDLVVTSPPYCIGKAYEDPHDDIETFKTLHTNIFNDMYRVDRELQNYVKYCSEILREYFGAVRKNMRKYWDDDISKLLSVISLNGFIIALTRQLGVNGVQDFDFYDQVFSRWSFDFSSEKFPYTSSQYRKFSNEILENAFDIPKETLETI